MKIFLLSLIGRGGTYHTNIQLSGSMSERHETHMLIPTYSETDKISKKVRLHRIDAPPNAFKTILLSLNVFRHIKTIKEINKINPDIIDIMDIHPWYVLYWPFLKAKKKVVTINDPELHSGEAGFFDGMILRCVTRFLLRNADIIVTLGKKQAEIVRRMGYKQKIVVSRIGHYGFLTKKKTSVKMDSKTILFFGRIKEYKGLNYLLDALIELKYKNEKFKLLIAGDGDLEPYKEKLVRLKDYVEIHNKFIADDSVAPYFERASFLVLPYTDATQTGIIPVAYSFKKAIIGTDVGSIPEFIIDGKTGTIVKAKNSKALAKAIHDMLNNPQKTKAMGLNGYEFMKKELDWDVITEKLLREIQP